MVYVEESPARGQLVVLFYLFNTSDRQEHADRRAEGEEICRLKVQRVVDNRHLRNKPVVCSGF